MRESFQENSKTLALDLSYTRISIGILPRMPGLYFRSLIKSECGVGIPNRPSPKLPRLLPGQFDIGIRSNPPKWGALIPSKSAREASLSVRSSILSRCWLTDPSRIEFFRLEWHVASQVYSVPGVCTHAPVPLYRDNPYLCPNASLASLPRHQSFNLAVFLINICHEWISSISIHTVSR